MLNAFWSRDSIAGLGIAAVGGTYALGSLPLGIGSLAVMGSGFFPLVAGLTAVLIGVSVLLIALRSEAIPIPIPAVRSMLFVAASVIVFALTIDRYGLIPAILLCGTISSIADKETSIWQGLLLSSALAVGIWLVFVKLLSMPMMAVVGI